MGWVFTLARSAIFQLQQTNRRRKALGLDRCRDIVVCPGLSSVALPNFSAANEEESAMALLVLNAGSSSLKLALYDDDAVVRQAALSLERIGTDEARLRGDRETAKVNAPDHATAFERIVSRLEEGSASQVNAIGHRVVHGGSDYHEPEPITPRLLESLRNLEQIDPTHMPQALAVMAAATKRFRNVAQIACFDTAFHRLMPRVAQQYPLPRWTMKAGVRRYGFHGLSCESILRQLHEMKAGAGRVLIAHLGNGASVTAVRDGVSVDTSMGFSPTSGIMMGTRCGDLDPTVLTYLARTQAMGIDALEQLVNERSGLLGVSGLGQDMRDLLEAAESNSEAAEAIELYCYTARKYFGALAAVLGGVETIVFTGGVGENAAPIRENICAGLLHLGVDLDLERNRAHEVTISSDKSRVTVRVVRTNEDLMIAKHVARLLQRGVTHVDV